MLNLITGSNSNAFNILSIPPSTTSFICCPKLEITLSNFVAKDNLEASGDSIMGLLMLAASKGSEIDLVLSGKQSQDALMALSNLVDNLFGEEM